MRPILDTMQTMPVFVYLIPALLLFGLGNASAVIATVIYAIVPVIRLTSLHPPGRQGSGGGRTVFWLYQMADTI